MIEGVEDPLYMSRRLICFASEDVGFSPKYGVVVRHVLRARGERRLHVGIGGIGDEVYC